MTEFSDHLLGQRGRPRRRRIRPVAFLLVPAAAILFQVYAPRFAWQLGFLELPLLVTVYFALLRREPVAGLMAGCVIGLAQDVLSHNPLGVFGISKTLVGYFAASLSQRVDVENGAVRFLLGFFFYFFHQFTFWVLVSSLLNQPFALGFLETLLFGVLNAAVAVPLYAMLDRL
ncbi:MAG: rod shape-determining protein MreD [Bryobacteraceae bacterium]